MNTELKKIQNVLKREMKIQKLTYDNLAKQLQVSPATIKRMLNNQSLEIGKLKELCLGLGLDFYEVIERSKGFQSSTYCFSNHQEKILAQDFDYFLVFRYLILKKDIHWIKSELKISTSKMVQILKALEQVKLIERHPFDKIKLIANFPFKWIESGPLERTYSNQILGLVEKKLSQLGLNRNHEKSSDLCITTEIVLSTELKARFKKDLEELVARYKAYSEVDLNSRKSDSTPYSAFFLCGSFPMWSK